VIGGLLAARRRVVLFLSLEVSIGAGLTVEEAFASAAEAVAGAASQKEVRGIAAALAAGEPLARLARSSHLFSQEAHVWLSAVGAGVHPQRVFAELGRHATDSLDHGRQVLSRAGEPLLILVAGVMFSGFVVLAVIPLLEAWGGLAP
jgi:type II secretory pathway component PulF